MGTAAGVAGGALRDAFATSGAPAMLPHPSSTGIDHIVVLMMENRSFDHYLGWVRHADGRQAGLVYRGNEGRPHRSHHLTTTHGCGLRDPGHSHDQGLIQFNNGKCDGFRRGINDDFALGYYTEGDLPFYGPLVHQSTVCDRWFASTLGPTMPNRNYSHAGRTDRMTNSWRQETMPTIWDRLMQANVPATYYFNDVPDLARWGDKYVDVSKRFSDFLVDAASGRLPQFSYIDPPFKAESPFGADDHPHQDIRRGQAFTSAVVQALVRSPLWPRTALVITYDEWGGFFDHVRPPRRPDDPPLYGISRSQTGFRVPAFVVSPYAHRGGVSHTVYDHSSIVKFVCWRFGLRSLAPRDRAANNLAHALDFRHPDFSVPHLPVVPDPGPHFCGPPVTVNTDEEWWRGVEEMAQRTGWDYVD